ncbi:26588_t:CDS:1, partial [Dentiscutata erythropus]
IRITIHEPRDVGTTNRTTQRVCKDYIFGKTIRFYVELQEKIDNLNLLQKEFELIKEQEKINIL